MQEEKQKGQTDTELCANWGRLVKEFNDLWDKSPKDIAKFEALKEKAKITALTPRQMDGIIDRCNNVLKGQYGNTKTAENMGHEKQEKTIPASNGKAK